jgi:hypothetical protein
MLSYLDKAIAIATDPKQKAFDNGEYGAALWSVSAAKGDTASEQRAKDLMDQKAAAYPVAGQFAIATILYSAPAGSDALKKALDAQFNGMDLCASTHFDRAHPDVSVYLHARFTDPACGNDPKFPHHMQGGLFKLADMLAKNGQADAARPVYEAIKNSDGYETWQFKNLVQDRMNSDLTLPLKGGLPCLACHQN